MVTNTMWKCYRCNLSFKEQSHAEIHKNISNHNFTKITIQVPSSYLEKSKNSNVSLN
jgi:hypothetical protein